MAARWRRIISADERYTGMQNSTRYLSSSAAPSRGWSNARWGISRCVACHAWRCYARCNVDAPFFVGHVARCLLGGRETPTFFERMKKERVELLWDWKPLYAPPPPPRSPRPKNPVRIELPVFSPRNGTRSKNERSITQYNPRRN